MRKKIIDTYFDKSKKLTPKNKEYVNQFMNLFDWLFDSDQGKNDISTKLALGEYQTKKIKAKIIAKEKGVLAGIDEISFFLKNRSSIEVNNFKKDGSNINSRETVLILTGNVSEILAYERMILNILGRMSGIAAQVSDLITKHKLSDGPYLAATRKTPWMWLDKKAVFVGGGLTHRLSLSDGILIKDNHLSFSAESKNNLKEILLKIKKKKYGKDAIEIEIENRDEAVYLVKSYLNEKITNSLIIMLDNFSLGEAKKTIFEIRKIEKKFGKSIIIEISGGVSEKNLGAYSQVGADVISLGELTHSAKALDLSLSITSLPR